MCARPRKSPDAISAGCFFLLLFLCAKEKVSSIKIFFKVWILSKIPKRELNSKFLKSYFLNFA